MHTFTINLGIRHFALNYNCYNCSVLGINLWSSRPEVFCKKVFLKISRNSQFCVGFSFLIKWQAPATLLKKTIRRGCFCEFREIFKNTCNFIKKENPTRAFFVNFAKFSRTPFLQTLQRATASVIYKWFALRCKPQIVNYQVKCN